MASAFNIGIWRTIRQSTKRFVSILVICALGVTMVCGLRAACVDLRNTADEFYDAQQLYDLKVQSTLGLSADDVDALAAIDGVGVAEGTWEETTYTTLGDARASVDVKVAMDSGMNAPLLREGRLAQAAGEVAVTEQYLKNSGASIGDVIELDSAGGSSDAADSAGGSSDTAADDTADDTAADDTAADDEVFTREPYTIVGVVVDPAEMTNPTGSIAIRAAASSDYFFFVDAASVKDDKLDTFTAIYLQVEGASELMCYSSAYTELVEGVSDEIEAIKADREKARTQQLKDEANQTIAEEEAKANSELDDALAQIEDAQAQLDSGQDELDANRSELASGQDELDANRSELAAQKASLAASRAELEASKNQLAASRAQAKEAYEDARAQAASSPEAIAALESSYAAKVASFDEIESQLASQEATLDAQEQQISATEAQLSAAEDELASGQSQLEEGSAELESAQADLDQARADYEDGKLEAETEIADARAEVDDIEDTRWYLQDRTSNTAYSSVQSDAGSIEAIGYVFPVVFVIVAMLVGLTTITRLVEEERSLIGTYKSLGYSNAAILKKYFLYALSASLAGSILGEVCGFLLFPAVLFNVFSVMYSFENYGLSFDILYGVGSFALFTLAIAGAAVIACRGELSLTPAALMRPKPPAAGSRILLERIKPLWSRMSFLNKVSARNLFRYKKRLFMTVFGIMGCTALLVCGFAIKDSVVALSNSQYTDINRYDLLVTVDSDLFEDLQGELEADTRIEALQAVSIDNVTLASGESEEALQLYVVPDATVLSEFVNLRSDAVTPVNIEPGGMLLTRNACEMLGVAAGDSVSCKTSSMDLADVEVKQVIDGYLGNAAYMDAGTYEELFGQAAELNGFYANVSSEVGDPVAFAHELAEREGFRSVNSTQQMIDEFSQAFQLINTVVYVIIVLAAALAFVVLFTLSTTNISERTRELATIKVLGFRPREINRYVNKETFLLTALGVVLGCPAGWAFAHSLTFFLKMPSIYFAVFINPISYVYAAGLTLLFALVVAWLSNRSLAKIDMIEALKSVE